MKTYAPFAVLLSTAIQAAPLPEVCTKEQAELDRAVALYKAPEPKNDTLEAKLQRINNESLARRRMILCLKQERIKAMDSRPDLFPQVRVIPE